MVPVVLSGQTQKPQGGNRPFRNSVTIVYGVVQLLAALNLSCPELGREGGKDGFRDRDKYLHFHFLHCHQGH